jgi:hypothetical protein
MSLCTKQIEICAGSRAGMDAEKNIKIFALF